MKISHVCLFISILTIGYILYSHEYFIDAGGMCPMGSWCPGNNSFLCPSGTYGSEEGLSNPNCSGQCKQGYWCSSGSTSATQNECPAGYYCIEGSTNNDGPVPPIKCPAGYYCPSATATPLACPEGNYCPEGTQSINAKKGTQSINVINE
jgi:hypothetical protein